MIEKNIFMMWFGKNLPDNVYWLLSEYQRFNPDFNIMFIYEPFMENAFDLKHVMNKDLAECINQITSEDDNLYKQAFNRSECQYIRHGNNQIYAEFSLLSDAFRLFLLNRYGGIYVDVDVQPKKAFDDEILSKDVAQARTGPEDGGWFWDLYILGMKQGLMDNFTGRFEHVWQIKNMSSNQHWFCCLDKDNIDRDPYIIHYFNNNWKEEDEKDKDDEEKIKTVWFDYWNNFGDMLVPYILRKLTGIKKVVNVNDTSDNDYRLMTLGSLLYNFNVQKSKDIIWGTGCFGRKNDIEQHSYKKYGKKLDIRMVRGPLTRNLLLQDGQLCPECYGDPGILASYIFNVETDILKEYDYGIVFHKEEYDKNKDKIKGRLDSLIKNNRNIVIKYINVDCRIGVEETILELAKCRRVISSAMHPIIVSEAMGIECAYVKIDENDDKDFKLKDYCFGSGRTEKDVEINDWTKEYSIENLKYIRHPKYDLSKMLDSFPFKLAVDKNEIIDYYKKIKNIEIV